MTTPIVNELDDTSKRIIEIITEKLNSTIDSVRHYINKLKKQNIIKHEGSTKAGKWVVMQ